MTTRVVAGEDGGMRTLARPRHDRVIAGVCAGVARRFGLGSNTVRILTVLGVLFAGLSVWAYILLWIVMPLDD